jgi:hypothetical protein
MSSLVPYNVTLEVYLLPLYSDLHHSLLLCLSTKLRVRVKSCFHLNYFILLLSSTTLKVSFDVISSSLPHILPLYHTFCHSLTFVTTVVYRSCVYYVNQSPTLKFHIHACFISSLATPHLLICHCYILHFVTPPVSPMPVDVTGTSILSLLPSFPRLLICHWHIYVITPLVIPTPVDMSLAHLCYHSSRHSHAC